MTQQFQWRLQALNWQAEEVMLQRAVIVRYRSLGIIFISSKDRPCPGLPLEVTEQARCFSP